MTDHPSDLVLDALREFRTEMRQQLHEQRKETREDLARVHDRIDALHTIVSNERVSMAKLKVRVSIAGGLLSALAAALVLVFK